MKAKISALDKNFLVEFKDESEFVSFITQHNEKINNVEILDETTLPELQKSVEVAKPSMSDGWKTLEKSAFVQKEKGVEKKGMQLGGKYSEFKYEGDKTLDASADSKVSEPKNDSPALKGDEPKASSVEEAPKAEKVKAPKAEEPAKEEKAEKSEEPKEEKKEESTEESEDKDEEKKEIKESVEDEDTEIYHKCSFCDDEFPESDMKKEEDMGWLCHQCWKDLESREGELKAVEKDERREQVDEAEEGTDSTLDEAITWIFKRTAELQSLKQGELGPIENRDVIAESLAKAAAVAYGLDINDVLKGLQEKYKIFPNKSF